MTRVNGPIIVVQHAGSKLCIIQVSPGVDPSVEPLLSHAGLACELGGPVEVAMSGMKGTSNVIRQFLTSFDNDLEEEVLRMVAADIGSPARHPRAALTKQERAQRLREVELEVRVVETSSNTLDMPEP